MGEPLLQPKRRRPLTVWELPDLLIPVHQLRRHRVHKRSNDRPHFSAILAFVYRSRFAVASQVMRRFPQFLKSARTARRHLEEMETLGLLGVAPARGVGPLFPKVYFVTGQGLRKLRKTLARHGKRLDATRADRHGRYPRDGFSAEHILHEVLTTEFMLNLHLTVSSRGDLELLATERRSLNKHAAFRVRLDGRWQSLIPDAMFLFRREAKGMVCCFLETDMGTMNSAQLTAKLRRYEAWSQSDSGREFLRNLYAQHGAMDPQPEFRLLFVVTGRCGMDDNHRLVEIANVLQTIPQPVRKRLWVTILADLRTHQQSPELLSATLWRRGAEFTSPNEWVTVNPVSLFP